MSLDSFIIRFTALVPLTNYSKDAPTNPRGIPQAPFVDKVEEYVSSRAEVDGTMKSFQEMISKYQFMEVNTQRRAAGLKEKIPDIQKTLETVQFLIAQEVSLWSASIHIFSKLCKYSR